MSNISSNSNLHLSKTTFYKSVKLGIFTQQHTQNNRMFKNPLEQINVKVHEPTL